MKILLDMGHTLSGADTGASGCGYREENCTREIGGKLKEILEAKGHTVVVVSCDSANSVNSSLSYRVNKANNAGGDLYIALHLNAFNGQAYGTEVFTYGGKEFAEAKNVLANIVALGYKNRGIKDGSRLYVLKNTSMKSMLIECCFIDNYDDMARYNAYSLAKAIAYGITGNAFTSVESPIEKPVEAPKPKGDDWIRRLQAECNRQGFSNQSVDGFAGPNTLAGCPMVRYGARGNITKLIQERLISLGYNVSCGADGIFGNGTRQAVMRFQQDNGLGADGIVGRNTWRALLGL